MKYSTHYLLCILLVCCPFYGFRPDRKPTLFIIGNSHARNGSLANGGFGQWGWGSFIHNLLDTTKISIQNRAMGGSSSTSYIQTGLWDKVLAVLKPGDFVLIQFDKSEKYIQDSKSKGATPFICSPGVRNVWINNKINRRNTRNVEAMKEQYKLSKVPFIDLYTPLCDHYDKMGQDYVSSIYFGIDSVHTIEGGAKMSASLIAGGLRNLKKNPLKKYLLRKPRDMKNWKYAPSPDPRKL